MKEPELRPHRGVFGLCPGYFFSYISFWTFTVRIYNPLRYFEVSMSQPRVDKLTVLRSSALLSSLTGEELVSLVSKVSIRSFAPGEQLFGEGESCRGLHLIARGRVRIYKSSPSGREQVLAINVPGESVAELPVFDGGKYPASAMAIEETEVAFIAQADFRSFCVEHPEVALKMLAVVGSRLRRLVGIIEELSFTTVRQRLVAALLKFAQNSGSTSTDGIRIELPGTHQELANQLGTVRELISRNLQRLQAEGLVAVDARHILLKDLNGLRALLD